MNVPAALHIQRLSLDLHGPSPGSGETLGLVATSGSLKITTEDAPWSLDLTEKVRELVAGAGVTLGLVVVFSKHTTAAVVLNENEPLLMQDIGDFLERLVPRGGRYRHNDFSVRTVNMTEEESPNGHAHCQHWLLGSTEVIPVVGGEMSLGRWQRIFLVELDRARERELVVQVWGISVQNGGQQG